GVDPPRQRRPCRRGGGASARRTLGWRLAAGRCQAARHRARVRAAGGAGNLLRSRVPGAAGGLAPRRRGAGGGLAADGPGGRRAGREALYALDWVPLEAPAPDRGATVGVATLGWLELPAIPGYADLAALLDAVGTGERCPGTLVVEAARRGDAGAATDLPAAA